MKNNAKQTQSNSDKTHKMKNNRKYSFIRMLYFVIHSVFYNKPNILNRILAIQFGNCYCCYMHRYIHICSYTQFKKFFFYLRIPIDSLFHIRTAVFIQNTQWYHMQHIHCYTDTTTVTSTTRNCICFSHVI